MKYIVYRQPVDAQYPWEINKNLFNSDGYILASITNANANIFDWVKWDAVEVTEEMATSSLWGECSIKNGQTERYRKWIPQDLDMDRPTLDSYIVSSTTDVDDNATLRHVLSDTEIIAGGEWNKFIMNRIIQKVFDSRFSALNISDSELEKATYQAQLSEATNYMIDNTTPTPLLTILSTGRAVTVSQLATNIISANDIYNSKVVTLLAQQKIVQDQVKAVTGIDDTLLLKEDLFGVMVSSGLAISSGRAVDDQREVDDNKYGIQF